MVFALPGSSAYADPIDTYFLRMTAASDCTVGKFWLDLSSILDSKFSLGEVPLYRKGKELYALCIEVARILGRFVIFASSLGSNSEPYFKVCSILLLRSWMAVIYY